MLLNYNRDAIHCPSFKGPREQVESSNLETVSQSVLGFLKVALARVGEVPEQILWGRFSRCVSDVRFC